MCTLQFLGVGSAFSESHTAAFFENEEDFVLIDCSMLHVPTILTLPGFKHKNTYVLITHTHGDHVSGLGTLVHYCKYVLDKTITIIATLPEISYSLKLLLNFVEHCDPSAFNLIFPYKLRDKDWFVTVIPTSHTEAGHSCGFALDLEKPVIYTGDCNSLEPFKDYLTSGVCLYTEISACKSNTHLFYEDVLDYLKELTKQDVEVYLMHIDNFDIIRKAICDTDIKIAPTYSGLY